MVGGYVWGVKTLQTLNIVLLETSNRHINKEVCVVSFISGEFDMVIQDIVNGKSCVELYEIKHSKEALLEQSKNLRDEDKCKRVEFHYGKIVKKCVLYCGEDISLDGIEYKNVEEYLLEL